MNPVDALQQAWNDAVVLVDGLSPEVLDAPRAVMAGTYVPCSITSSGRPR